MTKIDAFEALLDFIDETRDLLLLSIKGIAEMQWIDKATEVLREIKHKGFEQTSEEELRNIRRMAKLAKDEVANGFPLLVGHTVVAVWSALEVAIPDALIGSWNIRMPSQHKRSRESAFPRV